MAGRLRARPSVLLVPDAGTPAAVYALLKSRLRLDGYNVEHVPVDWSTHTYVV